MATDDFSFDDFMKRLLDAAYTVDAYYTPFLCLFGALGNSLSVAVFCFDSKYRNQSSSYYLSALAVSDTGFLLNLFLVWLQSVYGNVITTPVTCPLVMFLGQVTCFMSVYLMVAFSIERYIAVHYPFARQRICTRENSKRAILALFAISLVLFSYVWVIAKAIGLPTSSFLSNQHFSNSTIQHEIIKSLNVTDQYELQKLFGGVEPKSLLENETWSENVTEAVADQYQYHCTVPPEYYRVSEIANYLDSVVTLIIPFALITFLNIKIYISVWKYMHERQKLIACPSISITIQKPDCEGTRSGQEMSQKGGTEHSSSSSINEINSIPCSNFTEEKLNRSKLKLKFGSTSKSDAHEDLSRTNSSSLENTQDMKDTRLRRPFQARFHQTTPTDVKVTKTLLLVSTVFLMFNLPLHAIRCAQFIQYMSGTRGGMDILRVIQAWATQLFNTNFAVNFLLYCVSGRNFRQSLKRLITRHWINKDHRRPLDQELGNRRYQVSPRVKVRTDETTMTTRTQETTANARSNTIEVY